MIDRAFTDGFLARCSLDPRFASIEKTCSFMARKWLRRTARRVTSIAVCVLFLAGCSRAVEIPRQQVGAEEYRKPGDYRIRLKGWNEYYARRFSVTDSTIVIEELVKSDDHYKLKKHDMPIVVPREDVVYVGVMETNWPVTAVVGGTLVAGIVFFVFLIVTIGDGWE
jgi:hypothetical protein